MMKLVENSQKRIERMRVEKENCHPLAFESCLIGALSCYVDDETWDACVTSARKFAERKI